MRQASQQELCLKLQQTVRHLQNLVMAHEEGGAALAAQLRDVYDGLAASEAARRDADERAQQAEARVDALEASNHRLRDELERQHEEGGGELAAELQGENLHLHDLLRGLEVKCRQAEETAGRKATQVETLQEQLMGLEEEALALRSDGTETRRLTDENALLASQLRQLELNVQDLTSTAGLGHNNAKQRIQYHLRLKQELEELRSECMALLRERFHLEQCVRYMAARAAVGGCGGLSGDFAAAIQAPVRKNPLQPACLQRSHRFATPSARAALQRSGRGSAAAGGGGGARGTPTKAELVASIEQAVGRTATSFQELAGDVESQAGAAAQPLRRLRSLRSTGSDEAPPSGSSGSPSEDGQEAGKADAGEELERRILSKIGEICSPCKSGRTSRLLRQLQEGGPGVDGESAPSTPKAHPVGRAAAAGAGTPAGSQQRQQQGSQLRWK